MRILNRIRVDKAYVTVDTKDVIEIMWRLTFAPCDSKHIIINM